MRGVGLKCGLLFNTYITTGLVTASYISSVGFKGSFLSGTPNNATAISAMFDDTICARRFLGSVCNHRCCKLPCGSSASLPISDDPCYNGMRTLASY